MIDGGLQSLGQQTLSCGVPLGMFVGGGDMQRFILCKVAVSMTRMIAESLTWTVFQGGTRALFTDDCGESYIVS